MESQNVNHDHFLTEYVRSSFLLGNVTTDVSCMNTVVVHGRTKWIPKSKNFSRITPITDRIRM